MLLTSTKFYVLTGAALLAGGIAFADTGFAPLQSPHDFLKAALFQEQLASKGDRLAMTRPAEDQTSVSIVEIVGLEHATVILRGNDGKVLYRSDPRSGMTTVTKNTDLPVMTMKEEMQAPAVQTPPVAREESEEPRKVKRQTPVGCVADVSPLARASSNRMPSLCLASLEQPLS
ncbi:hypothetical protein MHY87_06110 [Microvirga sp. ACRRW]|uniref:hypothetical protein n=1 Tax=Microvirga sp. ACRRW TaxID=2918205 RepID=UPI001EF43B49|nr:hypothetical protein [Microvirga sp. ACRRW]MCG7392474.1 hypothetical protein [Microvirga sp. ACRRW]